MLLAVLLLATHPCATHGQAASSQGIRSATTQTMRLGSDFSRINSGKRTSSAYRPNALPYGAAVQGIGPALEMARRKGDTAAIQVLEAAAGISSASTAPAAATTRPSSAGFSSAPSKSYTGPLPYGAAVQGIGQALEMAERRGDHEAIRILESSLRSEAKSSSLDSRVEGLGPAVEAARRKQAEPTGKKASASTRRVSAALRAPAQWMATSASAVKRVFKFQKNGSGEKKATPNMASAGSTSIFRKALSFRNKKKEELDSIAKDLERIQGEMQVLRSRVRGQRKDWWNDSKVQALTTELNEAYDKQKALRGIRTRSFTTPTVPAFLRAFSFRQKSKEEQKPKIFMTQSPEVAANPKPVELTRTTMSSLPYGAAIHGINPALEIARRKGDVAAEKLLERARAQMGY
mmetsp:Transcript_418/g.823  ORF Transcript_418/g.823 Transcript_418/m.823 type:complete len:405 (-) Transcript_418:230-1444(-)